MLIGVVVMLMVLVLCVGAGAVCWWCVLCAGGVCCVLVLTLVSLSSGVDPAKTAERNAIRHAISVNPPYKPGMDELKNLSRSWIRLRTATLVSRSGTLKHCEP
jgi:hypothetical protein